MGGKEAAVAPILPAPDEESLDAHLAAFAGQREDVAVPQPFRMNGLASLDIGQGAKAVAIDRRQFEIPFLGRLGHLLAQPRLNAGRLARQELLRILDQLGIILLADPIDAGRRAAPDLIEQARPRAVGEKAVGAASQQEQLLQRVERAGDRPGTGERSEILPLGAPGAAMLLDARKIMVLAQQDEGEALVVAQQHVEGGPEALDQLRLEQQRLGLGPRRDDRHVAGLGDHPLEPFGKLCDLSVVDDPVLQRPRLADVEHLSPGIEHAVDAGPGRQGLQHIADRLDAGFQVRRIRPTQRVGRLLLIEAVARARMVGPSGRRSIHFDRCRATRLSLRAQRSNPGWIAASPPAPRNDEQRIGAYLPSFRRQIMENQLTKSANSGRFMQNFGRPVMIGQTRAHLRAAGENYWQHFRFATTFGLLAIAAGLAAILHAFVPALCSHTASRIVRHLGQLLDDRSRIDAVESEAVEARAFVLLLILATAVVAPLWLLGAPLELKLAYTGLAYALPAALMFSNPELITTSEKPA